MKTKRVIFSPSEENFEKLQYARNELATSYSEFINMVLNEVDQKTLSSVTKDDVDKCKAYSSHQIMKKLISQ